MDEQKHLQKDEVVSEPTDWAAYVVGSHPQRLRIWEMVLYRIARTDMPWRPPWPPWDIFFPAFDQVPPELFEELETR